MSLETNSIQTLKPQRPLKTVFQTASCLRAVIRINRYIFVRQVAGVYRRFGLAALQIDAHGDFVFIHHRLPLLFGVTFGAAAVFGNQHVAQPHPDSVDIQIGDAA